MKQEPALQTEPYMAFVLDDITQRSVSDLVHQKGWEVSRIFEGGIEKAIKTLQEIATPELLVIDLSDAIDPVEQILELGTVCDAGVRLICLGTTNDVTLYRALLELGVEEYLLKPIDPAALDHAVERALTVEEDKPEPEEEVNGEVMSIVGALGGVGASSIALNLAWDAAHSKGKKVALVDMDLHFGTLALSLDLEPGKGFREALENPSRIDSLFLDRAMVKLDENLHILASETDIDISTHFGSDALEMLMERLRQKFDLVIVDLPRTLLPDFGELLSHIGKLAVISDLSLAGMRDSLRISRFAKKYMEEDNLYILANRVGENKERELAQKEFEKGIECSLLSAIPFDAKAFALADMQAEPLVKAATKSKAAQSLEAFFDLYQANGEVEREKIPFWKKILKG